MMHWNELAGNAENFCVFQEIITSRGTKLQSRRLKKVLCVTVNLLLSTSSAAVPNSKSSRLGDLHVKLNVLLNRKLSLYCCYGQFSY